MFQWEVKCVILGPGVKGGNKTSEQQEIQMNNTSPKIRAGRNVRLCVCLVTHELCVSIKTKKERRETDER